MKKKVCFVIPSLGGGGAERVAFHLLNNLNLDKFELSVIIIYENKGEYLKDLRKEIKKIFLNKTKIRWCLFSLFNVLNKEKPDIVINFSFDLMIIIGNFIIPFLKDTHFINRQINILSLQKFNFIKKILLKNAYKNFDKIITQSKDMTDDLLKNISISKSKIEEINNPIDIKRIEELSKQNIKIELKKEDKNLLCVGRLAKQKGFDIIINIISSVESKNIKLYILGEGTERKKLENLIKEKKVENRVFLLGRKENPYIYMKNADLFILSSKYEGFPNVLIEANACKLYAICNNCPGGVNEIIKENINGSIIDFNEKDAVLEKIDNVLYHQKIDKEKIRDIVKKRYSIEKITRKYEKIL